jgi:hypothetical protein
MGDLKEETGIANDLRRDSTGQVQDSSLSPGSFGGSAYAG